LGTGAADVTEAALAAWLADEAAATAGTGATARGDAAKSGSEASRAKLPIMATIEAETPPDAVQLLPQLLANIA
jgi:hypothetical protein